MATNGHFTRAEVDRFAILTEREKALKDEAEMQKELFRKRLSPGEIVKGFAYVVVLSRIPKITGKPDYRRALIDAIGLKAVKRLEADAAEDTTNGTPSVLVRPNAEFSPDLMTQALKVRRALYKAIGEGRPSREIITQMREMLERQQKEKPDTLRAEENS